MNIHKLIKPLTATVWIVTSIASPHVLAEKVTADKKVTLEGIEKRLKATRAETRQQNEKAVKIPPLKARQTTEYNEDRNVYFGDTHVHTSLSFDSYLSGNRLSLRDAYRFASGDALTLRTGETMQISQPLDFVVMTDHAEGFGLFVTCAREELSEEQVKFCESFDRPTAKLYKTLRGEAQLRPPIRPQTLYADDPERSAEDAKSTWNDIRNAADEFYQPGVFTTFAGYEYSPPLPRKGKLHRNVIFKNANTPDHAVSAFDAATVLDLWRALEQNCIDDCEFLTIPHNMNKSWGLAYSGTTIDGDAYTKQDWALRARSEPLVEIFQIKGSSECGLGVGATDEECNFELVVPICDGKNLIGCSGRTSFAREGLKIGMQLQESLGFNPIQTGFIGSTDVHSSNPGDTEEYDYRGASANHESPARKRLGLKSANNTFSKSFNKLPPRNDLKNPGGLAAVWAKENTREAIFEALKNRETYATSGNRMRLRFFAGWDLEESLLDDNKMVSKAYANGVPMGSVLPGSVNKGEVPSFLIEAVKDSNSTNLQRVQMIKGWMEGGEAREQVFDIACSDGLTPDPATKRCPDNEATVDLTSCEVSSDKGAREIRTHWRDPDFDASQAAFYYVRVLENPSCRWSTYDTLRLGVRPLAKLPATIQERAWSSPIWYNP